MVQSGGLVVDIRPQTNDTLAHARGIHKYPTFYEISPAHRMGNTPIYNTHHPLCLFPLAADGQPHGNTDHSPLRSLGDGHAHPDLPLAAQYMDTPVSAFFSLDTARRVVSRDLRVLSLFSLSRPSVCPGRPVVFRLPTLVALQPMAGRQGMERTLPPGLLGILSHDSGNRIWPAGPVSQPPADSRLLRGSTRHVQPHRIRRTRVVLPLLLDLHLRASGRSALLFPRTGR